MTNLSLGLALLVYWLLPYTGIDRLIMNLFDFNFRNLAAIGTIILVWAAGLVLLKRMRVSIAIGPMYLLLALSNALAMLTLVVHAYNDAALIGRSVGTVEEIMVPPFLAMVEFYLGVAFPFVKLLLLVSTVTLVVSIVRQYRHKQTLLS